jgi:hypothetical protein
LIDKIRDEELRATEPLGGTDTGIARKTDKSQCPEKTETPHLRSTVKLKSKEWNIIHKSIFPLKNTRSTIDPRRSSPFLPHLIRK